MNSKSWTLVLVVAVALFAFPALAQQDIQPELVPEDGTDTGWYGVSSYDNGQYMDNPCTAVQDWVWVNYSAYIEAAQKEAGVDRYLFNEDTTMGGSYSASGSSHSDVAYGAVFSLRMYHKVSTYDDFHVVTVINFDPASRNTGVSVETACGNGMPDSRE